MIVYQILWGLHEQFTNHLSLVYHLSFIIDLFSIAINLKWISSLTYKWIPTPFESWYNLCGVLKRSIRNWLWGKMSSIFVWEIISISILTLTWSLSNSNLFLMEFMLKWANINLLTLSLSIDFRVLSQKLSYCTSNDTSELHSLKFLLQLFLNILSKFVLSFLNEYNI